MAITAKVRNKQIDTGKVLHALVQGENASGNITFQIIGETELVEDFNSTYFYLLYTRPSDTRPNVLLLTNKQLQDDVISVTFKPTSYFTAQDGTVQIQIMATDTEGLSIDSETGTISGSVIWQTFPGAMFVHASQLTGTETIIEENVLTQYLAGMQELYSQTEDAEGDAADYAQLAKDWASKTNGAVEGGEMSAKYYAGTADSRAKEAEGYAVGTVSGSPSASFAGKNAKELASDAQDWAKGTRSDGKTPSHTSDSAKAYAESAADSAAIVSAHAEAIDAIGDDLTNIDAVAADILDDDSSIDAVAANITNVNAVAANETNINAVNTNKTNINTVAGKATEITTVAGIASDVSAVAAIASDVAAVEDIDDDVSAVAAIAVDVGVVADAATDVAAVADGITDVGTVATNISDVGAVASDITKIAAVADDLTNIDAVADDLTNIDAAEANALKAEGWANGTQNGTDVDPSSPYYHNNAKYWAGSVPTLKGNVSALDKRVSNLEESLDVITEIEYPDATYGTGEVPPNKSKYAEVDALRGVSRVENMLFKTSASGSGGGISYTNSNGTITLSGTATSTYTAFFDTMQILVNHSYLVFFADVVNPNNVSCMVGSLNSTVKSYIGTPKVATAVIDLPASGMGLESYASGTNFDGISFKFFIRDLNVYFGTMDLSFLGADDSAKLATIQTNYPELLIPSDYGTQVVFPTYTGVVSKSNNLIDEADYSELALLTYADDYFSNTIVDTRSFFQLAIQAVVSGSTQTLNQINVESVGRKSITFTTPSAKIETLVIKHNGSARDFSARFGIDIPVSTRMTLSMDVTGYNPTVAGGVRFGKLKLEEGATATDYTPYGAIDTLTFPSPVTVKRAGSVPEMYYPESGRVTHPLGSYTFTGNETGYSVSSVGRVYLSVTEITQIIKIPSSRSIKANILSTGWITIDDDHLESNSMQISVTTLGQIGFCLTKTTEAGSADALKAYLQNNETTIYFELATPSADTYVDPIPDPFIQVEGVGTIKPVQTNEPEIDSAMTVSYVNKITA